MAKQRLRRARPQQIASSDRVSPGRDRMHEREQLPTRPRRPRTLTKIERLIDQPLQPEPRAQRRRQQQAGIRDQPLIVELDRDRTRPHRPPHTIHHQSDLLGEAAAAQFSRSLPAAQ
jgi:hypothetical protein